MHHPLFHHLYVAVKDPVALGKSPKQGLLCFLPFPSKCKVAWCDINKTTFYCSTRDSFPTGLGHSCYCPVKKWLSSATLCIKRAKSEDYIHSIFFFAGWVGLFSFLDKFYISYWRKHDLVVAMYIPESCCWSTRSSLPIGWFLTAITLFVSFWHWLAVYQCSMLNIDDVEVHVVLCRLVDCQSYITLFVSFWYWLAIYQCSMLNIDLLARSRVCLL